MHTELRSVIGNALEIIDYVRIFLVWLPA